MAAFKQKTFHVLKFILYLVGVQFAMFGAIYLKG